MGRRTTAKKKAPVYEPAIPDSQITYAAGLRIAQAFVYADLRYMLPGLKNVLKAHGIKIAQLGKGQCVPFINTNRDYIKVIVGNGTEDPVLACYRFPRGRRMPLEAISEIYQAFGYSGNSLSADERLRLALEKYGSRRERAVNKQQGVK